MMTHGFALAKQITSLIDLKLWDINQLLIIFFCKKTNDLRFIMSKFKKLAHLICTHDVFTFYKCGRTFVSASNQVLFALGWAKIDLHPTRMNLLNPISGRDASYPCLISLWPKEGCTVEE